MLQRGSTAHGNDVNLENMATAVLLSVFLGHVLYMVIGVYVPMYAKRQTKRSGLDAHCAVCGLWMHGSFGESEFVRLNIHFRRQYIGQR